MLKTLLIIGLGGAIGSMLRYLTSVFVARFWENHFPLATFITNVIGCFLIGLFIGFLEKQQLANSDLKWFLITGFCGGYTTFSTFGYENFNLLQNQNMGIAFAYIASSVIIGLMAVWFGLFVAKM
ncbi:fluoride efflux transporter CrcB [Flavobacterium sp. PLA-1-15]|uniref:fluoride efflux transporter CrcB n=1 Tax=Flavobacterium sp. PLA-1-15 TaxID=3380533 RepID=UPI003B822B6F